MNEAAAREVLLVQAFETAAADSALWTAEDRAWASRAARESRRCRRIRGPLHRRSCAPRAAAPAPARAGRRRHRSRGAWWRRRWIVVTVLAALLLGALADQIGSSQRINLLAPPAVGGARLESRRLPDARRACRWLPLRTARGPLAGPLLRAVRSVLAAGAAPASKASPGRAALQTFDRRVAASARCRCRARAPRCCCMPARRRSRSA